MLTLAEADALFARRGAAWLREDHDGYLACWAEDMTFGSPVHTVPIRGREAYARLIRASAQTVRPLRFAVDHLAVRDDVVLAEWEIEAEHRASGARLQGRGGEGRECHRGLVGLVRGGLRPPPARPPPR